MNYIIYKKTKENETVYTYTLFKISKRATFIIYNRKYVITAFLNYCLLSSIKRDFFYKRGPKVRTLWG